MSKPKQHQYNVEIRQAKTNEMINEWQCPQGVPLRVWLAGMAMSGRLANPKLVFLKRNANTHATAKRAAVRTLIYVDALISELEKDV